MENVKSICEIKLSILQELFDAVNHRAGDGEKGSYTEHNLDDNKKYFPFSLFSYFLCAPSWTEAKKTFNSSDC